ncbi:hypothetical protein DH2020_015398 [Rehmannia glutinosa]|uniref:Retroviral polymerase SH3-like domain-containing protein n=1 Tax=Rehmannia glutinosa TaxID=99300 RepID=A0ABR0WV55_REHGL
MTKRSFTSKGLRAKQVLELVRSDVCGPISVQARGGYEYLLNMVLLNHAPKTPLELWNGRKPNLRHIRIWGCPAHVLKGKMEKMESRSEVCIFIGYPKGTRGYYFYSPQDKKVFVSTNATFLEDRYIEERESKSKVLLEEMREILPSSSIPEFRTEPTQF